jgi:hypothetical protein
MKIVARTIRRLRSVSSDERGIALFIAAGSMLALTSVCALAIDVGMLYTVRTEAQRAADGAALAGAAALIESPKNSELATLYATRFGSMNTVDGEFAVVLPEDVSVDLEDDLVKVDVLLTAERGSAVGTFFARMFGVTEVDIGVDATARASAAGGVNCPLPVAVPDRWHEAGGPGNGSQTFDPELGDYYVPWFTGTLDAPEYNPSYTGYDERDIGTPFTLTSNQPNAGLNGSWYYPWRPSEFFGADDYRYSVMNCIDPSKVFFVGIQVDTEPGNMAGPTMQGFDDLINQDPAASWNDVIDCIVDRGQEYSADVSNCRSSPRVRPLPMFDPSDAPELGAKPFKFTNFAGIFVESIQGKNVNARWVGYTSPQPAPAHVKTTAGPLFKSLQLVE